jgi:hypothetical protein
MFKVFKLTAGEQRTLLSGGVPSKTEAVALAEAEVGTFQLNGYNLEHGFFWGRNESDGQHVRVWIER